MRIEDVKICILRVGGTNCDDETRRAFSEMGVQAEIVHANKIVERKNLFDYNALVIPGGFSYGDYVRAGAIWAKWLCARIGKELEAFVDEGRPVLGICNGFQVLIEAGLLPAFGGITSYPEAALATNVPPGYNCRWISMKLETDGKCVFTSGIRRGKVLHLPVAHSEGRFIFAKEREKQLLKKLRQNEQLVFRYCTINGKYAEGKFPTNPNGSFYDIAGICNPEGNVFGLMPHPERAYHWWQQPDWTERELKGGYGDGRLIFESLIDSLAKKL